MQISTESSAVAAALSAIGFDAEDRIGILAEGRPQWIAAEFGIVKARSISVPMSIKLTSEEIAFRISHSSMRAVVALANTIGKITDTLKVCKEKPLVIYLDEEDDKLLAFERQAATAGSRGRSCLPPSFPGERNC